MPVSPCQRITHLVVFASCICYDVVMSMANFDELRVRNWIKAHRGILASIACKLGHSHQYVQQVAYGRATSNPGNDVEVELRRLGWPGIRRRIK